MKTESLIASNLLPDEQNKFAEIEASSIGVAKDKGYCDFCLRSFVKYKETAFDSSVALKIIGSIKNTNIRFFTWLFTCTVAAILNIQSATKIVPSNLSQPLPYPVRPEIVVATIISFCFIIFIDRLIANEISSKRLKDDIESEKEEFQELQQKNRGIINASEIDSAYRAFKDTQEKYFNVNRYLKSKDIAQKKDVEIKRIKLRNDVTSIISSTLIVLYFSAQFIFATQQIFSNSVNANWTNIAVPLFGTLLNFMTGWYNANAIVYPQKRNDLSNEYKTKITSEDLENLNKRIDRINFLTEIYLDNNPQSRAEFRTYLKYHEELEKFNSIKSELQEQIAEFENSQNNTAQDFKNIIVKIKDCQDKINDIGYKITEDLDFTADSIKQYKDSLNPKIEEYQEQMELAEKESKEVDLIASLQKIYDGFLEEKEKLEKEAESEINNLLNSNDNQSKKNWETNNIDVKKTKKIIEILKGSIFNMENQNSHPKKESFLAILREYHKEYSRKLGNSETLSDKNFKEHRILELNEECKKERQEYLSKIKKDHEEYKKQVARLTDRGNILRPKKNNANDIVQENISSLTTDYLVNKIKIIKDYQLEVITIKGQLSGLEASTDIVDIFASQLEIELEKTESELSK